MIPATVTLRMRQEIRIEVELDGAAERPREKAAENTACHQCNQVLIERTGYRITIRDLRHGTCGTKIPGVWSQK